MTIVSLLDKFDESVRSTAQLILIGVDCWLEANKAAAEYFQEVAHGSS